MGGSSNQLVIYNGSDPKAQVQNSHFWSHSWLRYGAEMVRERLLQYIYETHARSAATSTTSTTSTTSDAAAGGELPEVVPMQEDDVVILENPCGFTNYLDAYTDKYVMAGTGNPDECQRLIERIVWADTVSPVGVPEGEMLQEDVDADGVLEVPSPTEIAQAASALRYGCTQGPCAIDEIVHPSVEGHQFYAMGAYYYALDCVRLIGPEPLPQW
jgi:hypothetical protein